MTPQDPLGLDTEKRLLLAVILSMAVLFGSQYLFRRLFPPPPDLPTQEEVVLVEEERHKAEAPVTRDLSATAALPRVVEVENDDLILRWSTTRAVLESARLKQYPSSLNPEELLELIPQELPQSFLRPLEIHVEKKELDNILSTAVYDLQFSGAQGRRAPLEMTFSYRKGSLEIKKQIRIPGSGYWISMETQVVINGRREPFNVALGPGIGRAGPAMERDFRNPRIAYYLNNSMGSYTPEELEEPKELEGKTLWVGLDTKFFSFLILGRTAGPTGLPGVSSILACRLSAMEWLQTATAAKKTTPLALNAEVRLQKEGRFSFFVGPKQYEALRSADESLVGLVDYGWFAFLVKPLLFMLKSINGYVGNYGWAIILLTFLINLVLFPVRYKQVVSMKKMSEVQPRVKAIQEKYKKMKRDDPRRQKMNQEVMALYKHHGVNPLGGCLPLVIQMPFLFAFYRMLDASIELRGAPFMGWVQDLSQPDPYYISPLVMGGTMIIQQKMTPMAGDELQRKMMMMLPLVFTLFFLSLSSGLVLYFLFSNLFAMMFQLGLGKWKPHLARKDPSKGKRKKK